MMSRRVLRGERMHIHMGGWRVPVCCCSDFGTTANAPNPQSVCVVTSWRLGGGHGGAVARIAATPGWR
eukprot:1449537-Prymnesium_polylepis.2